VSKIKNYLISMTRLVRSAENSRRKLSRLQQAIEKKDHSLQSLTIKLGKLERSDAILRRENDKLKKKVREIYERNKEYARRLRDR